MPDRQSLAPREHEVCEFVRSVVVQRGRGPSYREIVAHFGFRSPSLVTRVLRGLERKGFVVREAGPGRGLRLMDSTGP